MRDPERPPPENALFGEVDTVEHLAELLELTEQFLQQASPQVRTELAAFLTTQHGWNPRTGLPAFLDSLGFTALGLRQRHHRAAP